MTPLFSTSYFPPIAYVAALIQHTEVFIEVTETYPKQTYRNRTEIMTAAGKRSLTVPVIRENHSRTEEVTINYRERWNVIHLRTLDAAYSASPYYLFYRDNIEAILMRQHERLIDLNHECLVWTLKCLKKNCRLKQTNDFLPPTGLPEDYRFTFSPKIPYPTDLFPTYCQVFSDRQPFVPNLSILDLLFNLGPEAIDYIKTAKQDK